MANYFDQFDTQPANPVNTMVQGGNFFDQFDKPEERGLLTRIGEDLRQRGANMQEIANDKKLERTSDTGAAIDQVGNQFGAAGDILGQVIASGAKTGYSALPESVQNSINNSAANFMQTPLAQKGLSAAQSIGNKWDDFEKNNPIAAQGAEFF